MFLFLGKYSLLKIILQLSYASEWLIGFLLTIANILIKTKIATQVRCKDEMFIFILHWTGIM